MICRTIYGNSFNFTEQTIQVDINESLEAKKKVLEALEIKYGIVTDACKSIGLNRSTFYGWLNTDPEFKEAVDEIQEVAIDFVEGKLFERIKGVEISKGYDDNGDPIVYSLPPDVPAINLYLRTRGKRRGYFEKHEFVGKDGSDLFSNKSDDELKQLLTVTLEKLNESEK